jgi:hypothetical protein
MEGDGSLYPSLAVWSWVNQFSTLVLSVVVYIMGRPDHKTSETTLGLTTHAFCRRQVGM